MLYPIVFLIGLIAGYALYDTKLGRTVRVWLGREKN